MFTFLYMCIRIYIYISFFSHLPPLLSSSAKQVLYICVNVQLNNRRQWLDRMAFDDVFSNFLVSFFLSVLEGVSSRPDVAHYTFPPPFRSILTTSNAWTVVEYSKKSFVLYISVYSCHVRERRKSYTRRA